MSVKLPRALGWRFGLVVLLLATFSLALGTQNAVDNNRNTRCLAQYAARNAEVAAIRSAATSEKDSAVAGVMDPLVTVILDITAKPPRQVQADDLRELRRGAVRYERAIDALLAKRAANPLPAFPRQCSELNQ